MAAAALAMISTLTFVFLVLLLHIAGGEGGGGIGINYGRMASNLPPPALVARFLDQNTVFDRVKLFDGDPATLDAFAGTGLAVNLAVSNDLIPALTNLPFAQRWVRENLIPHAARTNIARILVGNEVASTANRSLIVGLVPAMQNLHTALAGASLQQVVKVTTPHSMGILSVSSPPSAGRFREGYDVAVVKPLLSFLRATGAPFMVNVYPFFGSTPDTLDYALFRPNGGAGAVVDPNTGLAYGSMLDAQLDAVFSAMEQLGFGDVEIVVSETGWPSRGEAWEMGADAEKAREYNANVVRHVTSGAGTPLMPNRTFEAFIFSLFNEDLKPGPASERNFGLFTADMIPLNDIGVLRTSNVGRGGSTTEVQMPPPAAAQAPSGGGRRVMSWCLPKPNTDERSLQVNIDFACGQGLDCRPIQAGGSCFFPATTESHAAFAMNQYYQLVAGRDFASCDFGHTGVITLEDPSYGSCKFSS